MSSRQNQNFLDFRHRGFNQATCGTFIFYRCFFNMWWAYDKLKAHKDRWMHFNDPKLGNSCMPCIIQSVHVHMQGIMFPAWSIFCEYSICYQFICGFLSNWKIYKWNVGSFWIKLRSTIETCLEKCLEVTFAVIWFYINKDWLIYPCSSGASLHGLWGIPQSGLQQKPSASDLRGQLRDLCGERWGYRPGEVCGESGWG